MQSVLAATVISCDPTWSCGQTTSGHLYKRQPVILYFTPESLISHMYCVSC